MTIFITQGKYTHAALQNMIETPEDRWDNAKRLVEAAGGTLLQFYMTYGEYDFLMIAEASSPESYAPVLLAAASTGGVSDLTTVPAMTTSDAKTAFEAAKQVGSKFRPATGD